MPWRKCQMRRCLRRGKHHYWMGDYTELWFCDKHWWHDTNEPNLGVWTQEQIDDIRRRAKERYEELRPYMDDEASA